MDKITHQVRAEHWARILNECMNSGMPKTVWCRANGISEKQFFYWQRILRREAYGASQDPSLPAVTEAGQLSPVQQSVSFAEIKLDILVREYRCSGGTDTASPAAGNRCSGTEIPHLIDCYLRVHSLKAGSNPYTSRIDR